jgi:thioredoxin-like negative regulator of GroEL
MGLLRRILGLETNPGEPEPLNDENFEQAVSGAETPVFVNFFHLWCSSCQVTGGLLNEIGPDYIGKARFYKMDVTKNPHTPSLLNVRGVPTTIVFAGGAEQARHTGLVPIDQLREWIEAQIGINGQGDQE